MNKCQWDWYTRLPQLYVIFIALCVSKLWCFLGKEKRNHKILRAIFLTKSETTATTRYFWRNPLPLFMRLVTPKRTKALPERRQINLSPAISSAKQLSIVVHWAHLAVYGQEEDDSLFD